MNITADIENGLLLINGAKYRISCDVRSLENGRRRRSEVIRSIPHNFPYDPRPFPRGIWSITGVEWQKDKKFDAAVYGPCKIRTDAKALVTRWTIDEDGDYYRETAFETWDSGYLLHYSESSTTLGCIRLHSAQNAVEIGNIIERALRQEQIELEVI